MPNTLTREPMGRKPDQPSSESESPRAPMTSTRADRELIRKANVVAGSRGKDLFTYLDDILRPVVEADYAKFIRAAAKDLDD